MLSFRAIEERYRPLMCQISTDAEEGTVSLEQYLSLGQIQIRDGNIYINTRNGDNPIPVVIRNENGAYKRREIDVDFHSLKTPIKRIDKDIWEELQDELLLNNEEFAGRLKRELVLTYKGYQPLVYSGSLEDGQASYMGPLSAQFLTDVFFPDEEQNEGFLSKFR